MSEPNIIDLKDYLPSSETITVPIAPTSSTSTSTNQHQDLLIESGTNTFSYEKTVTPSSFILKSNESYKVIKSNTPLNYNIPIESDKTVAPTTTPKDFDNERVKFLLDDISALTNQNSLLRETNKNYLNEIRGLRENKRLYSSTREEIKSELKDEYDIILEGEQKQMKKILDLQIKFLLDGLFVLLFGFLGMFLYYRFDIRIFTPILYFALIIGGFGWFLTALISIRRD